MDVLLIVTLQKARKLYIFIQNVLSALDRKLIGVSPTLHDWYGSKIAQKVEIDAQYPMECPQHAA